MLFDWPLSFYFSEQFHFCLFFSTHSLHHINILLSPAFQLSPVIVFNLLSRCLNHATTIPGIQSQSILLSILLKSTGLKTTKKHVSNSLFFLLELYFYKVYQKIFRSSKICIEIEISRQSVGRLEWKWILVCLKKYMSHEEIFRKIGGVTLSKYIIYHFFACILKHTANIVFFSNEFYCRISNVKFQ